MNQLTTAIRNHKFASWCFAITMGFVYWYLYGRLKNGIWLHRNWDFINRMTADYSPGKLIVFTALLNAFVELTSTAIPAAICGMFLANVFQQKALRFSAGAIIPFLLLSSRLWRYWFDPHLTLSEKILVSSYPILDILVLIFTIWLILKIKGCITAEWRNTA